jgi:peptide/nickel transport system substrate-binding protein
MFNFEDINRKLFHSLYTRTESYFDRSVLSSKGHKANETEAAILGDEFKNNFPDIYNGSFLFPKNRATGIDRRNIRKALKLLKEAGYELKAGRLVNKQSGTPFSFEILTLSKSQEPLLLSFIENLKLLGITAAIRQVDSTAYQKRQISFDFDMMQNDWPGSLSPGNEQLFRWSSKQADTEGSFNYAGIRDKGVDKAIEALLAAKSHEKFVSSVRALDRVLLSGDYVIPLYHLKGQWLAHWAHLRHPDKVSNYGTILDTWWSEK